MIASSLREGEGEAIIDILLQKDAEVNKQSYSGQTALHFASSKDSLDIVKKLIAHKASARVKDKRGQLALHRAAAIGSVPVLKLLLESRSPVNATDMDGLTALHHAISEGHGQAAVELLKAGADTNKEALDGRLAIDMAPDSKVRPETFRFWGGVIAYTRLGTEIYRAASGERGHRPIVDKAVRSRRPDKEY